jgi:hypothetical protein
MDAVPGLPCMPTLNGWLLGYPVVYLVGSYEEAAAASRALSACTLSRFAVRLPCAALPGGANPGAGGGGGGGGGGDGDGALLAFTAPQELHGHALDAAAAAIVASIGGAAAAGAAGAPAFPAGLWAGRPALTVEAVGPGAVSL